jgi:hypothetical protein
MEVIVLGTISNAESAAQELGVSGTARGMTALFTEKKFGTSGTSDTKKKETNMSTKQLAIKETEVVPQKEITMQDALMAIVQRTDIDPDRLEKFLDLQIKMENRQAELAFNNALAQFQGDCPIIQKSRKIDFEAGKGRVKYNYSPLDEIVHIIKPILSKYGLSYSFDMKANAGTTDLLTTISHRDGFSKTFTYPFDTIHDDGRMNSSQRRKSALTYAKRGALENALGIVTAEEDDDARRAVNDPITAAQTDEIMELIKVTKSDEAKFLAFLKVKSLSELSEYEGRKAIMALKEKRAQCIK